MPLYDPPATGGSTPPAWAGVLHAAIGNGEPEAELQWSFLWGTGTTAITPTNISATVARVWTYKADYDITPARLRWFAVAGTAAASNFRFGMYRVSDSAQVLAPQTLTFTGTDRWTSHALPALTLAAGSAYYCVLSATATATTWSLKASGIPATYPHLAASQPGNLHFTTGTHRFWFGQMTVVAGLQPAVMPILARGTGWGGGGIPLFYFDANNAA